MPALTEIETEVRGAIARGVAMPFDAVRLRHMRRAAKITGNTVAVYATCFVQKAAPGPMTSIVSEDVQGFMNILSGADKGKGLDLILHSPGGTAEAAESIADYLHQHFAGRKIRVIVPHLAMSAATMLACAADEVVMGSHSSLGPVDPQLALARGDARRSVAVYSVISEFEYLMSGKFGRDEEWTKAVLGRYGVGLLDECKRRMELAEALTGAWLQRRMFADDPDREGKAARLAGYLANHEHFKSHGRRVSFDAAQAAGMKLTALEEAEDGQLQDAVLSVFHALSFAFANTPAAKIIASDVGRTGRVFARSAPFGPAA